MKWIVLWTLVEMICGSPPPTTDEFGRISHNVTAVCNWQEVGRVDKKKEFATYEEAKAFYDKAKQGEAKLFYGAGSNIENVRLAEVKF